ncbi:MAG: ABC transporter substrate-binding protein [Candidatus Adiutrix sp.]|jgi:branched-chain amino acid transport system substrate-binding protein|nr:ABC transporter substrate-binding protein [Candidatus Adiutrix sp.]
MKKLLIAFCLAMLFPIPLQAGAEEEKTIVIGSIFNQTGIAAPIGQSLLQGAQAALAIINEEGGIFGRKVELHNIDAESDPALIANAASRLANELKVPCVVGLEDDSLASAAGPILQEAKTVLLVGSATTPTIPGMGDYIFLNAFGDNVQGRAAAKFAVSKLGWKRAAVIRDSASAYSVDTVKFFSEAFREYTKNPKSVVHEENYQTGDTNFTAQLARLKSVLGKVKIDGILLAPPFPQDAPILARQMVSLGIKLPVLMTDGGDDQSVIDIGGPSVEGLIVTTHFAPDSPLTEAGKKFTEKYRELFKSESGAFECLGYDGVRTLAEAIATIGREKWDSLDLAGRRTAIRDTLQSHKFVTPALPKFYPDPAEAKFPRTAIKPVVFLEFKGNKRVFRDQIAPEEL